MSRDYPSVTMVCNGSHQWRRLPRSGDSILPVKPIYSSSTSHVVLIAKDTLGGHKGDSDQISFSMIAVPKDRGEIRNYFIYVRSDSIGMSDAGQLILPTLHLNGTKVTVNFKNAQSDFVEIDLSKMPNPQDEAEDLGMMPFDMEYEKESFIILPAKSAYCQRHPCEPWHDL